MSCVCQNCGKQFKVDLIVPDELWDKIKPEEKLKGGGLLCGSCIMDRIEKVSDYDCWFLSHKKEGTEKLEDRLNETLVKTYGEIIVPKLDQIKEKIAVVVAAEVYSDLLKDKELSEIKKLLNRYLVLHNPKGLPL